MSSAAARPRPYWARGLSREAWARAWCVRVERHFHQITQDRMRAMPGANPALQVEGVGFHYTEQPVGLLGILITPWSMSLLHDPDGPVAAIGQPVTRCLPAGEIEFTGAHAEELGAYESCSVVASMGHLPEQAVARVLARETLAQFLKPVAAAPAASTEPALFTQGQGPLAAIQRNQQQPLDRRGFLRGVFLK